jgi:outer membrane protein W
MIRMQANITVFVLACAAAALNISSASAQSQCVGPWRVAIETTSGTCQPNEKSRAINVKENGQIELESPSTHFDLSGSVAGCRTISFILTRNGEIATGAGQITGNEARGTWIVTQPASKQCSGWWYAKQH